MMRKNKMTMRLSKREAERIFGEMVNTSPRLPTERTHAVLTSRGIYGTEPKDWESMGWLLDDTFKGMDWSDYKQILSGLGFKDALARLDYNEKARLIAVHEEMGVLLYAEANHQDPLDEPRLTKARLYGEYRLAETETGTEPFLGREMLSATDMRRLSRYGVLPFHMDASNCLLNLMVHLSRCKEEGTFSLSKEWVMPQEYLHFGYGRDFGYRYKKGDEPRGEYKIGLLDVYPTVHWILSHEDVSPVLHRMTRATLDKIIKDNT